MTDYFILFTFYSTHLALEFERSLKAEDIFVKLIPVPRKISSSCGLAGKIKEEDLSKVKVICDENKIEFEEIYKVFEDNSKDPEIIK
ncbi:MAG: DUF3343 domain-containing protein [Bacillota bacterium]